MDSKELVSLIDKVKNIAIIAGQKIMEIYDDTESFETVHKSDNSPLTRADREANTIICNQLKNLSPQIPIISEENKLTPYSERKGYEYLWMVDPLDGTKEFIKRNGEFTVNIALIYRGNSIAGVVYTPATATLYYGIKKQGAYKVLDGRETKLNCATYNFNDEALSIVCSRSHLNEETEAFINAYNKPVKVSKGSSLKFLILAEGKAHVYPRLAPTMEWDTAAAHIIVEEAGGHILRADNNQALKYNKENLLNPHFVAYAHKVS